METHFPTASELLSLAAFFVLGNGTEILLETDYELDAPQEVRAWLHLDTLSRDYGVAPDTIMAGLQTHVARGVIRMAHSAADRDEIYIELRRDARREPGYRPWTIRQGVRLLLEGKRPTPAPLKLA